MELKLDLKKTVEQNATDYFDRAKKSKKKIEGIKKALTGFEKEKEELLKERDKIIEKEEKILEKEKEKRARTRKWYEKFRWFISSEGFLCIGGRDATTNEIVIKKHAEKDDIVFHTEAPGSPFFIVKTEGKKPGEATLKETAQATAAYSKAWKMGLASALVYWIKPDQVRKELGLPKGSFMIHGKRNYSEPALKIAVGVLPDKTVMAGPVDAVKKNCGKIAILVQGRHKKSDIAKKIAKIIDSDLDEIISALPAGEFEIEK
jgi:predicted ribosome quality control (RQC) complex YloA/Tae2 family protein